MLVDSALAQACCKRKQRKSELQLNSRQGIRRARSSTRRRLLRLSACRYARNNAAQKQNVTQWRRCRSSLMFFQKTRCPSRCHLRADRVPRCALSLTVPQQLRGKVDSSDVQSIPGPTSPREDARATGHLPFSTLQVTSRCTRNGDANLNQELPRNMFRSGCTKVRKKPGISARLSTPASP